MTEPLPMPHPLDAGAVAGDPEALRVAAATAAMKLLFALPGTPPRSENEACCRVMGGETGAAGVRLTAAETVEHITRRINFGPPERGPKPARGPWPRDMQHHRAAERRKGLFAALVRNPASAAKGGQAMRDKAAAQRARVEWWAGTLHATPRHKLAAAIVARLLLEGVEVSERTVRRYLRASDKQR